MASVHSLTFQLNSFNMNRRELLKASCAFCGLGIVASSALLDSCTKITDTPAGPSVNFTLDLGSSAYSSLLLTGRYVYKNGVIVANTGQENFVAVAQRCTHQGCTVQYDDSTQHFICPCHGGTYDLNGQVLYGPPIQPLRNYKTSLSGNTLTISS